MKNKNSHLEGGQSADRPQRRQRPFGAGERGRGREGQRRVMRQLHVVVLRDFPLRGRRHSGRSLPRQRGRNVAAVAAAVVVEQSAGGHLRVAADGGFRVQEERISGDVWRNVDVLEHLLRVANLIWRSAEVRQGGFEEVELRGK